MFDIVVVLGGTTYSAGCVANNVDPDQTKRYVASDLGLHCLLRPVCRNI